MQLKDDTNETVESPVPPVAEANEERLEDFSALLSDDYREFKEDLIEWLLIEGRDTYKRQGYRA